MQFWGANMFLTILFPRNQDLSCVLYIWQAELSHVGFSEEKVLIIITRWGYGPKCNWQAGNRFELYAGNQLRMRKASPSMLRVFNIDQIA
jgi:hypothetical protein